MKRQLLVAQLVVLFDESTAQHRLRRQTLPAPVTPCRRRSDDQKIAMVVQPLRHRLQLTTDLVLGEKDRICGPGRCVLGACRLPRLRVCFWNQSLDEGASICHGTIEGLVATARHSLAWFR